MIRKGIAPEAVKRLDLLDRVAKHKSLFFRSSWAKYEEAAKGTLHLSPATQRIAALREDFGKMRQMFFGEPPEFEAILDTLQEWEWQFNRK